MNELHPQPLISVIIPTHNNADTIGIALESILNQTWRRLEVIVVDDGSTDATKNVVEDFAKKDQRVSYYLLPWHDPYRINKRGRNINAGYLARNYGFTKVAGEYITFQDADDASFANRIEYQFNLLQKYNATHVCLDWQQFEKNLLGKQFVADKFIAEQQDPEMMIGPEILAELARSTKGPLIKFIGRKINSFIPFEFKRFRIINRLFFGSLAQYPGTGNSPLFKREVIDKVQFRPLKKRIWPSFMGRGADRDFNFQVAETFKNSYTFFIPLYLWRQNSQNTRYAGKDLSKYVV
jgi:glycosyltransferase involved in cell wall biosynthesis